MSRRRSRRIAHAWPGAAQSWFTVPEKMVPAARENAGNPNTPGGVIGTRGGRTILTGRQAGGRRIDRKSRRNAGQSHILPSRRQSRKEQHQYEQTSTSPDHGETSNPNVCSEGNRKTCQPTLRASQKSVT